MQIDSSPTDVELLKVQVSSCLIMCHKFKHPSSDMGISQIIYWDRKKKHKSFHNFLSFAIKQRPAWFWIQIAGGGGCGAHWQIKSGVPW